MILSPKLANSRLFWSWLNQIFNRVDHERIKEVGPDRAAAEWILKNGGAVKWTGKDRFDDTYDSLISVRRDQKIVEIDATGSSISGFGFLHLKGLSHVEKIILSKDPYINDTALSQLVLVKESLRRLEVSSCVNVTDVGIKSLDNLTNLKSLILKNLMNVKNMESCVEHLKKNLSSCQVESEVLKQ